MNNKLDLILLFGGKSSEHEVSLRSVYNVLQAVNREKYNVTKIGITKQGKWYLYAGDDDKIKDGGWINDTENLFSVEISPNYGGFYYSGENGGGRLRCDVVFPVMHGSYCEDGRLQGLLDMCGIKYVGCGTEASAVCMDKYMTKLVVNHCETAQAEYLLISGKRLREHGEQTVARIEERFAYPVFVKPACAGSSVGASKVRDRSQLLDALHVAAQHDEKILVEEYIKGRETEVAVLGNDEPIASVCGEINPGADFYDYETKYINDTASYFIPARLSEEVSSRVRASALRIYRALGCRGLARVDFFVTDEDEIIFNEINTLPGFTSISMYPSLFRYGGMSYGELIDRLIQYALED